MKLTKNFFLYEYLQSKEFPSEAIIAEHRRDSRVIDYHAFLHATLIAQPGRDFLNSRISDFIQMGIIHGTEAHEGIKILIARGYADKKLNKLQGGVDNSLHLRCLAADTYTITKVLMWYLYWFYQSDMMKDRLSELILKVEDKTSTPIMLHAGLAFPGKILEPKIERI